jgi:hypothetical protein
MLPAGCTPAEVCNHLAGTSRSHREIAMDATPQRHLITSRAELADGLLALIQRAHRCVRCCSLDGSVFGLGSARVLVLVDDPLWIETRAPRFKTLQRRFGHAVQIRAANVQDAVAGDMLVLIDDHHSLVLKPSTLTAGEIWLHNEHRARPLLADFDRRWAAASYDLPVVPLGL